MKGKTQWQERPHLSPYDQEKTISICRLAPYKNGVSLEWLDTIQEMEYILEWRAMYENADWTRKQVFGHQAEIDGLESWRDYEIRVARMDGVRSDPLLFRTAPVPGVVINYLHPKDTRYAFSGRALCSPCIVKLPSGTLLASMDVFAPGAPQNLTLLFRSDDRGESWRYVCDLFPLFWGDMFYQNGRLYILGCSSEFGDVVIGASEDEGETWTPPAHIFAGSSTVGQGWQQAPMPLLRHNGRIYVAMEYAGRGINGGVCVLSAPENANLLDAANWCSTPPMLSDPAWPGTPSGHIHGFCEGNLLVNPKGKINIVLRINAEGADMLDGRAAVLAVDESDPEAQLSFVGYARMPAGLNSKFQILFDVLSGYYVAVGNLPTASMPASQRNVLALFCSRDAMEWHLVKSIFDYRHEPVNEVGFQYPSFLIDGEDILLQVRTALNGARNYHDANYSTFHVVKNFRCYLD